MFVDLTSKTLSSLTCTGKYKENSGIIYWEFLCICGGSRWISVREYNNMEYRHCGCGARCKGWGSIQSAISGGSKSKIYSVWRSMVNRCHTPSDTSYYNYGGKGVFVCSEWLNSFEQFYADMGDIPFKGAQIDRINNDEGYYKENCRWVNPQQNNWNQGNRRCSSSKYKGVTKKSSLNKGDRWHSAITRTLNGETIHKSKTFNTEIEAAEWYNEQAKELFGEYAYLNKIDYSEKE